MPHRKRPSSSSSGRSTSERNKKHSSHRRHEKSSKKHSKERSRTRHTSRSRSSTRHRSSTTNNEHKSFQTTSVIATTNQFLNKEAVWKHLEVEIQKRKDRIEQCRAEHRIKLGIDKAKQQSAAKGKSWSLEVDRDNDEGDLQNVVIPQVSLTRDVAATRICASIEKVEDDEEDSLDKFMENITKEVKGFHENNTKAITTIKQEQFENNSKRSVIKIITKIVKNQSVEPSGRVPTSNSHHDNSSIIKTEPMDINDQPFSGPSYVTVHSDVVKPGKGKGLLMEQDMDGLEYSSEEDVESMSAIRKEKSKLDKMTTNHDKMYYRPFRKVFYTDISEIANMTEAEVAAYREELDGIKVVGKQCPRPIKTWSQCLTSAKILQSLKKYKYEKPTPIQAQALPIILSGRNMIGIAKTGSGKTLAFILPMFRHIIDQPPLAHGDGPIAVILTPTRELALQTAEECKKFGKSLDIRCIAVYGGKSISTQIAELKRGAEIIVCTPGRLVDMLTVNNGRITNVRRVTYVVVDEADRMFDMGFGPQVTKILDSIRPDRQIVMFSATFPKKMEVLARKYVDKPIEITVGGRSIVCKDIVQNVIILNDDEEKYLKLLELLGIYQSQGSILVFVDTQEHADELMKKVMTHFYSCMSLHGGIDQCDRDSIITDFKNGDIPIIIATSVAARGLDVKNLILVVNYDCPNHYEDYVHRCGRTGRAGNRGYAYTFITPTQERYAGNIIQALKTSDAFVPDELTLLWDGYAEKQKTMGIQVKACVGGFSGRGNNQFDRLKNQQTGLRDSVDLDEDEESQLVDQQIQSFFNKTKKCIEAKINTLINQNEETNGSSTVNDLPSKIELAKKVAARLTSNKSETRNSIQKTTTSLFQHDSVSGLIVAQQRANELNRKLNYQKAEEKMEFTENISQIFEDELEINDFPQNVRSKVMNKGILAHTCEYADVDIFVRGQYYPNNKEVLQTDRKLYLKIESLTERALQLAKEEITRLIKEEIMKMQNPAQQLTNRARYKV